MVLVANLLFSVDCQKADWDRHKKVHIMLIIATFEGILLIHVSERQVCKTITDVKWANW